MRKVLVSGIGPGKSGVGRFIANFIPMARANGYEIITQHRDESFRKLLFEKKIVALALETIKRLFSKLFFYYKTFRIENSEIIYMYPQSIGYSYFLRLVKNNTVNKLYVLDAGFFCIRSYNHLESSKKECLTCLYDISQCNAECKPLPVPYAKENNIFYLKAIKEYSDHIHFFVQNKNYEELVKIFYGKDVKCNVIGMDTGEIMPMVQRNSGSERKFDIVFHAASVGAKGVHYTIELAKQLPEYSFLIPSKNISSIAGSENLFYVDCNWENGLKEYVETARLVLCPSMWSAPIEGALLKSIAYNGNVAVVQNRFAFSNEIPDACVVRLSENLDESVQRIQHFMQSANTLSAHSQAWLSLFMQSQKIKDIFKEY